jgi:hypothetical protein
VKNKNCATHHLELDFPYFSAKKGRGGMHSAKQFNSSYQSYLSSPSSEQRKTEEIVIKRLLLIRSKSLGPEYSSLRWFQENKKKAPRSLPIKAHTNHAV